MSVPFTKVTFENEKNNPALDAGNLNAIENALQTLCNGGSGSGVDADLVRGKNLIQNLNLTKGLMGHWSFLDLPEYPDKASSTLYLRKEWPAVDSWVDDGSSCTVSTENNTLKIIPGGSMVSTIARPLTGFSSKTLKLKIKNTSNITSVAVLGATYVNLTLKPLGDSYIGIIELDSTVLTQLKIRIATTNTNPVFIEWIYIGDGAYDSKPISSPRSLKVGSVSGATINNGGVTSSALYLDGINDRVLLPIDNQLALNGSFSISLWATSASTIGTRTLFAIGAGPNGNGLSVNAIEGANTFSLNWYRSSGTDSNSNLIPLDPDTPVHILITYSTKTFKLYLNGVIANDVTLPNTASLPTGYLELGSQSSASYFKGSIAEVGIWDRALSAEEAWELYQRPSRLEDSVKPFVRGYTPLSATSPGNPGTIVYDSTYVYICIAQDTWKRAALTTW